MLHRIDVTIFDVADIIRLVPDKMLPKPPLPDAALVARLRTSLIRSCFGNACANRDLINRQRSEKSASPGGNVHTAWI